MLQIENELRQFIVDNFLFGQDDGELKKETSLVESGIIDSTGVLELVSFLQERFGVELDDEEIVPENMDCIHNLAHLVKAKINHMAPA